jgi:thiamine biosynthesis lipoprotein
MDADFAIPAGLKRIEFAAMGTTVSLLLPEDSADHGGALVRALFEEWEQVLSRFRPESELGRLNARAGEPVIVSPLLCAVLETSLRAAAATQGLYDPTLLRQIIAVGYTASFETLPADQAPADPFAVPLLGGAWRQIALDAAQRRVTLPPGVGLDFGGIAKGMAVDAAIARLMDAGFTCLLVNAGGDLAVRGLPPAMDAWPLSVPGRDGGWTVPLATGALATSGIARRRWRQGGVLRHHLLDPRTGEAAMSGLWSVSVAAGQCAQAEVAAKVAFILGPVRGAGFLEAHGLAGVLVAEDGSRIPVGSWPRLPLEHASAPPGTANGATGAEVSTR